MKLTFNKVDDKYRYVNKVKYLFEQAFPPIERPSFNMIMSFPRHEMLGVEEDDNFIGLVDLLKYQDTLYIFFLAIKKTKRGKGYGTKILKNIADKYSQNYRI